MKRAAMSDETQPIPLWWNRAVEFGPVKLFALGAMIGVLLGITVGLVVDHRDMGLLALLTASVGVFSGLLGSTWALFSDTNRSRIRRVVVGIALVVPVFMILALEIQLSDVRVAVMLYGGLMSMIILSLGGVAGLYVGVTDMTRREK